MNKSTRINLALIIGLTYLAVGSTASGQSGWSLKKLNPFQSSDDKSRATASISDSSSMPKLKAPSFKLPSFSKPKTRTASYNKPSSMQKINSGTKKLISKTSSALQPWKKDNDRRPAKPSKSMSSRFSWLLPGGKPEETRVRTPNEFLALPRP
jgi:hypothetical protein